MHCAYLAGLLDGEGSIMLLGQGPRRSRRPQLAIAITERWVLEEVQNYFGGYLSKSRPRAVSQWRINGGPALEVLRVLRPFLVIQRRQALADLLLKDPLICKLDGKGPKDSKLRHNEYVFQQMKARNSVRLAATPVFTPTNPSRADIAYLSGILDGEGYVSFDSRRIEVWSTDPELPAWLESKFGGNSYVGKEAIGNSRKTWRWFRSPTGCNWAAEVADEMLLTRKANELRKMQDFKRTPKLAPIHINSDRYAMLRRAGILRTVARRETGLSVAQARHLDFPGRM